MERPISIALFERCYLGAVAVGLVNTAVAWNTTMARVAEQPAAAQLGPAFGQSMLIGITALSIAIAVWQLFKPESKRWFGEDAA